MLLRQCIAAWGMHLTTQIKSIWLVMLEVLNQRQEAINFTIEVRTMKDLKLSAILTFLFVGMVSIPCLSIILFDIIELIAPKSNAIFMGLPSINTRLYCHDFIQFLVVKKSSVKSIHCAGPNSGKEIRKNLNFKIFAGTQHLYRAKASLE
ncbi:hypothetical protein BpHYR1_046522 [Brachionus plicatilis]|uniref:Uncharacterized protein n=1 Tax=Brachionus plicatilis TaxID=10195 RepID=A0A3M7QU60_BRAPC|nr:hypothetical protein BpHYR1_046522 [Brachionus plicatilis]